MQLSSILGNLSDSDSKTIDLSPVFRGIGLKKENGQRLQKDKGLAVISGTDSLGKNGT